MAAEPYDDVGLLSTGNGSSIMDEHNDVDPFENHILRRDWIYYCVGVGGPVAVLGGVFANILAFVVLARCRLWLKHEGYVYLAAIFCVNVAVLLFCTSSLWITTVLGYGDYYPPNTSNFMCKLWHFSMSIFYAYGWLSVALLFGVYLREHLTHRRRCGCPLFAAKYCTLFASKIIVGVIFSVLFIFGVPYLTIFEIQSGDGCIPSDSTAFPVTLLVESLLMWVLPFVFFLPIILLMTLCTKREGNAFGFSQIQERSDSDEQMRALAVTLSSMTLFSQVAMASYHQFLPHVYVMTEFIILLLSLSIALHPILCFVVLKASREEFRSQLRSICCYCCRRRRSEDRDEGVVQLIAVEEDSAQPA